MKIELAGFSDKVLSAPADKVLPADKSGDDKG